ncbi:MAG: PorT family protein [Dysgonamonadaceae bacterium]|jgi:hypothetical protein|nr:PorT family protein [Dysgonamonadaceae bacterium]
MSGWKDAYEAMDGSSIPGYTIGYASGVHLGLIVQYDLSTKFFLQPELLYSMQGMTEKATNQGSETSRLNFIQLPVYAGYKVNLGLDLNLILAAGPYLAYGINGSKGAYGSDGMLNRFDAGVSVMGGLQFNKVQITVGYDHGLFDQMDVNGWDTAKDILGLSSIQNRNVKLSAGYFF